MRWEIKLSLDDKLSQEYSYQKLLNLIILLRVIVENVGDVFWDTVY